jgi:hypothetical protein
MKRFEYKTVRHIITTDLGDNKNLDEFGRDGWELVAVTNTGKLITYYFKREMK